jgi:hypothetical protein
MEYTEPKMKINARVTIPAPVLVVSPAKIDEVIHMQSHTIQVATFEKRRRGRRQTRSTSVAPIMAKKNCWQALPSVALFWGIVPVRPAVSKGGALEVSQNGCMRSLA